MGEPGDGRSFESCLGNLIVPDAEASMLLFDADRDIGCEPGVGRLTFTNPKAEKELILSMIGMREHQLTTLAAVYLKNAARQTRTELSRDINSVQVTSNAWMCAVGKHLDGKEPTTNDPAIVRVLEKYEVSFFTSSHEVASALLQEVLATTAMCSAIAHALPRAEDLTKEYLQIGRDKYHIKGEITGGLGAVMLAERESDNQKVIIKFPLEDNAFMTDVLDLDLEVISKLAVTPVTELPERNYDDATESIHYLYSEVLRANPGMKAEEIVRIMRLQWQQISMLSFFLEFIKTIVAHVRAPINTAAPIAIGLAKHPKSEFPGEWALFSIQKRVNRTTVHDVLEKSRSQRSVASPLVERSAASGVILLWGFMWQRGVIHGDLHLSNIMVRPPLLPAAGSADAEARESTAGTKPFWSQEDATDAETAYFNATNTKYPGLQAPVMIDMGIATVVDVPWFGVLSDTGDTQASLMNAQQRFPVASIGDNIRTNMLVRGAM